MKQIVLLFLLILSLSLRAQLNMDSVSHVNYQQLHQANLNDVWGYADETGVEYALVGASKGTSIISLEDPSAPVEVFWEPGTESIWRDVCTWGDFMYVTTEADDGLLIVDLSPLPSSTGLNTAYYFGEAGATWSSAHTLYIDEQGYAYIFGSNRGNGGVIILDVHTDPMNPVEVGEFDNWYVHDGFVRNDTMYLAHIADGFFSLVDVTDRANPVLITTQATPSDFTHNIWPSDNGNTVFTTDEVSGAYIASYDISDPQNIIELDKIQSSPGSGIIPHNAHVLGNYLITSYYSDGITVHDITHPYNMVEVGNYDTYPGQTPNFDGCWGAYPFLPSGLILASDITEGLFILSPQYVQAAYLEGVVTDASTNNPLIDVDVQIVGNVQIDRTNIQGSYATGFVDGGIFDVEYFKVGYYPQTHSVTIVNGQISIKDVQLVPIPPFNLTVNVRRASDNTPVNEAKVRLIADLITHEGTTNTLGEETFTLYYQEEYNVLAGKWGLITSCQFLPIDENTAVLNILVEEGYYDNFEFDFGWNVSGNAETGIWERGKPNGTSNGSNPSFDASGDCGDQAYVTGNNPALKPDNDDVDGGTTVLISPVMDLTGYSDPYINYYRWFYCKHGAAPEDTMKVMISNGFETAWIDITGHDAATELTWVPRSIRVSDFLNPTSTVQIIIRVPDLDPDVNITEGGLDYFSVTNSSVLELSQESTGQLVVFPNPVSDRLTVVLTDALSKRYDLTDLNGKLLLSGELVKDYDEIDVSALTSGCYLLRMGNSVQRVMKE